MSPADSPAPAFREPPKRRWVEPMNAILMGLVTLCTAWCSYQSASYTRQANRLMNESSALERRASVLSLQGMQAGMIQVAMFMQTLAAQQAGNEKLARFYVERFSADTRKAYDRWLAQKPLENPQADPHPFAPNLYELPGTREAAEATDKAADRLQQARFAGNVSGDYLANTVLFATVLFFASTSGKFEQRRVRVVAFAFALAVFIFAITRTAMLPV